MIAYIESIKEAEHTVNARRERGINMQYGLRKKSYSYDNMREKFPDKPNNLGFPFHGKCLAIGNLYAFRVHVPKPKHKNVKRRWKYEYINISIISSRRKIHNMFLQSAPKTIRFIWGYSHWADPKRTKSVIISLQQFSMPFFSVAHSPSCSGTRTHLHIHSVLLVFLLT